VEKVDRLGQLMGALRRRVLDTAKSEHRRGASAVAGAGASGPAGGIEALRARIVERLEALPRDDEARAARIFVESVLVWEFGEALLEDPGFALLVEQVDERIAADKALRLQLRGVLGDLTGRASS